MLKRLIWMILLVIATTFTVVLTTTGASLDALIPRPDDGAAILPTLPESVNTLVPTATLVPIEVVLPTEVPPTPVPPTHVPTVAPSFTPVPGFTPTPVPTAALSPTPTALPFRVQQMTPIYGTNFAHPDSGCNWQGVAGQVFDAKGAPILNYIVKITGTYNTLPVSLYGVTGMANAKAYGPGGYEVVLGNVATSNLDSMTIQVFDQAGNSLSDPMKFSTSKVCTQNLVIINFMAK